MSEPPEREVAEALRWFAWAREDFALAEHIAENPAVVRRGACMWAHQAAEKALKARLVAAGHDPPKIHDLTRLARMIDDNWREQLESLSLAELSRWAIEGRYPGDVEAASDEEMNAALKTARTVLDLVSRSLGEPDPGPAGGSGSRE